MKDKPLDIARALRAAFTKQELEFLETESSFTDARDEAKTADDFVRLCELGEQLLKEYDRAAPAARQLRSGMKQTPEPRLRKTK